MTDELAALSQVPLFAGLDEARLRQLASRSTKRTVSAGSVAAARGEPAEHLLVVETGTLSAVHETPHGRRLRLGEFAAPCAIDKTAVLDARGHTATWFAVTHCQLRLLRRGDLIELIDSVPAARQHVLTHLATQLRHQQETLVTATFDDITTRVAAWLVHTAGKDGLRVMLPDSQEGLGETIGASRVSINRALNSLTREGVIHTELGAVTLLAPELLAQRATTSA